MAKQNRQRYLTPKGTLGWNSLVEPDTSYSDESDENDKGVYKAMLRLPKDDPDTLAFQDKIRGILDEFVAEEERRSKKRVKLHDEGLPWVDEEDRETGEPTGNILIRTKLKARVVYGDSKKFFDQRPKAIDASAKPIPMPNMAFGSTIRIGGQVNCWHTSKAGCTLWLEVVQVIDLIERNDGLTVDDYGFEAEEGYVAPDPVEEAVEQGAETTGGDF